MTTQARPRGRMFFANPGPTNIPDSILHATAHATVDFNDPAFVAVYRRCVAGVQRVLGTTQHVFFYTGSGHAAWEASLVNLFSPGDRLLMPETGYFSDDWAQMARDLGLEVQGVAADWRAGCDVAAIHAALAADATHAIKAVCVVHNETSTGMVLPVTEIRAALDAARHPALLLVDTISSLGSMDFRMDAWGVDAAVGGSQKGLMLPTGMGFTGVSAKAMEAHRTARLPRHYFSWTKMLARPHKSFVGTLPTSLFYGLEESLRLLEEEGLPQVFARHARLGGAVRAAVRRWSGNSGPQLFCTTPARVSDSVTSILMPEGCSGDAVRATALGRFNVSLGAGLGRLADRVFRIGHLGDLNEPMILGTLASVEMAMKLNAVPHAPGGVAAAMDHLTAS
ncbi:MAG: pyridoxal-phosphate-dependent aminotransferase family protein [Rhodospirillales bacterium]|jgi:alanine-glyoxylate transaminase/serine-glyoxylate transaminase/serine-pyruvate transaminase